MPFLLHEFYHCIGDTTQYEYDRELEVGFDEAYTFPRAIKVSGRRHLWDVVIKRTLLSIVWFPEWLRDLKAHSE